MDLQLDSPRLDNFVLSQQPPTDLEVEKARKDLNANSGRLVTTDWDMARQLEDSTGII